MKIFVVGMICAVLLFGCSKNSIISSDALQSWQFLSTLQTASGYNTAIAVDNTGIVYAAYSDDTMGGKITVQKYQNGSWSVVGAKGFSTYSASNVTLQIVNGIPYVGYSSGSNGATVEKYDNNAWSVVGSAGFTPGRADNFTMTSEGTTLYVAFQDSPNANKLTVMKYDGSWQVVGSNGISDGIVGGISITVSGGVIFVGYSDQFDNNKLTVKQYNGSWTTLTDAGTGSISSVSLAVNGGVLYAAHNDNDDSEKAHVIRYVSNAWSNVGTATGFTSNYTRELTVRFYNNNPYLAFISDEIGKGPSVMMFDGSVWSSVGSNILCEYIASDTDMIISNGSIYVIYAEEDNDYRISVKKY